MEKIRSPIECYKPIPQAASNWPMPKSDLRPARRRARKLRPQAIAQANARNCVNFLEIGHFAWFSQILHIKGRNFPDVFYPFTSTYDPYESQKVSRKSVCTFLRNMEDRYTDRQMWQLYIYIYIYLSLIHI